MVQVYMIALYIQIVLFIGLLIWGMIILIIHLFSDSGFTNKDVDFIIESEFKKKANRQTLEKYNKADEKNKKIIIEEFKKNNKSIVEYATKTALQNSVNDIISKGNKVAPSNVNTVDKVVPLNVNAISTQDNYISGIMEVAEHEFKVVLSNNEILSVRPKLKQIKPWSTNSNGVVMYDYQQTLDNGISKLKEKNEKNVNELKSKIKNALDEYTNSKYMAASITAVATNLSKK